MDPKTLGHGPHRRPWAAPALTELDLSATQAGASPNIQETVLTNDTFAIS